MPTPKVDKTIEEHKNEETPSIAPRMMKFKRNKEGPAKEESKPYEPNDKNVEQSAPVEPKEEEDKPAFVPRRFNLKLKDRKSEEGGYVASAIIEKKE
jgi:hypothetical protein